MIIMRTKAAVAAGFLGILLLSTFSAVNAAWVNATGNLAGMATECGDFQSIYAIPNVNLTTIGLANNGLYSTTDGGTVWTKMTDSVKVRLTQMLFDPDNAKTWYAGGIYHSPGIWKTTDAGATWIGFHSTGTNDGFAVDFSDPQRKTMLAGYHERSDSLFKSTDGGQTWKNIFGPPGGTSSFPYIINTQTYLMGLSTGTGGIFRSMDAGTNWTRVSTTNPISPIMKTAAGDLYYTGGGKVVKGSSDGGTWTVMNNSSVAGAGPVELPGGKIAVINANGIAISADKGVTWTSNRCRPLPTAITSFWNFNGAIGLTYNSVAGAFYTFKWGCVNTVAADEIWRFDTMITSGSEVIMPRHSTNTRMFFDLTKDVAIYNVLGRMMDRKAIACGISTRPGAVYILRAPDGSLVKRIYRK
jgi:hypothetical protein